jgi:hypothetical protein
MVDPPEEEVVSDKTLLERLRKTPPEDYQLYVGNHQDLCGAHPWTRKVLLAHGQTGTTGD